MRSDVHTYAHVQCTTLSCRCGLLRYACTHVAARDGSKFDHVAIDTMDKDVHLTMTARIQVQCNPATALYHFRGYARNQPKKAA